MYLRYTDGVGEWTAMRLFGDTVVEVESTKKMRRNAKDKKKKQGVAGGTHKFPENVTRQSGWDVELR